VILPIIIMIVITAIFVTGTIRYIRENHNCNKHELYFEDHESRGTFCSVCNRDISIEYYSEKKGQ
jgi:hypothetical protein